MQVHQPPPPGQVSNKRRVVVGCRDPHVAPIGVVPTECQPSVVASRHLEVYLRAKGNFVGCYKGNLISRVHRWRNAWTIIDFVLGELTLKVSVTDPKI